LFIFATNAIMDRLKADAVFAAVLEWQMPSIVENVCNKKRIETDAPRLWI
jgi:hypothetical protein